MSSDDYTTNKTPLSREQAIRAILSRTDINIFVDLADVIEDVEGFDTLVTALEADKANPRHAREYAGIQYFAAFTRASHKLDSFKQNHWFTGMLVEATDEVSNKADKLFLDYVTNYCEKMPDSTK